MVSKGKEVLLSLIISDGGGELRQWPHTVELIHLNEVVLLQITLSLLPVLAGGHTNCLVL